VLKIPPSKFQQLRLTGVGLQKLECSADSQIVNETGCDFQPFNGNVVLNLYSDLTQAQESVKLRIQQFKETRTNVFQPLGINFEVNICDMKGGPSPQILKTFEYFTPGNIEQISKLIRRCPYLPGRIELVNMTMKPAHFQLNFFKGRMKDVFRTFNGKGQTIYELTVYTMQV
jgi:hypothetical protein